MKTTEISSPLVMLIEDCELDIDLFARALALSKLSWNIEIKKDGEAALVYLEEVIQKKAQLPNLLLVDINLPKKNGKQLLSDLKSRPYLKCIPFVIYSGTENIRDVFEAYDDHVNAFLKKPVLLHEAEKVLHSINQFWFSDNIMKTHERSMYEF